MNIKIPALIYLDILTVFLVHLTSFQLQSYSSNFSQIYQAKQPNFPEQDNHLNLQYMSEQLKVVISKMVIFLVGVGNA